MLACVGEVCEDQWCSSGHQTLQTACSYRGTTDGVVNNNKTIFYFFIIKLMQYKDTSQQAFLIIYFI